MTMPLHYQLKGNRSQPTILFLHGFLGCHQDWLPLISVLQKDFCCLLVDLPGHGQSLFPKPSGADFFTSITRSLQQLLRQLDIAVCGLVGYSLGGRIALAFTVAFPHLVKKLVLESSHAGLKTEAEKQARLQSDEIWAKKLETLKRQEFLAAWYGQEIFQSLKAHPQFEALHSQRLGYHGADLAQALRAMSLGKQNSLWEALPHLKTEILLVAGQQDPKYCSVFEQMASLAPHATLFVVEGAGHNVHFEKPEVFSEILHRFLGEGLDSK